MAGVNYGPDVGGIACMGANLFSSYIVLDMPSKELEADHL